MTCAVIASFSGMMAADTLLVPTEYGSIQYGIDAATDGDIVSVDAGIYYETIDFLGKSITVSSADGDPSGTTIDGGVSSGSVVKFTTSETAEAILDGFTIRKGNAEDGGGIYIVNASPTIRNCIISENTVSKFGGGIYADTCTLSLENVSLISNESAKTGAGIYMKYCEGSITDSNFENNSGTSGCGIYVKDGVGNLTIANVMFTSNIGSKNGGAIYNKSSLLSVQTCTFDSNAATEYGGAFYSYSGGESTFSDCQFLDNTTGGGGGAANIRGSTASFSGCLFDGNIADSDCDGSGESGIMEIHLSSVTLENPTICTNLICDTIEDFSEEQPVIVGEITGCTSGEGACCGGVACWEMNYNDCIVGGGVWGGEETICAMVNCNSDNNSGLGGCCIDETCILAASSSACDDADGIFAGEHMQCVDVTCYGCPADLNGDGSVEVNDVIEVIASWGACP